MPDTSTVYTCREPDGQHVTRTAAEIVALARPYRNIVTGEWVVGDPSAEGSNALSWNASGGRKPIWGGAIIIPPPPPPTINWQSAPALPSGSTDYMVPPGNYMTDDPSRPLLAPQSSRKYIFRDSRLRGVGGGTVGAITDGFGHRLDFENCQIQATPPTVYGKSAARLIRGKEIRYLRVVGCDIPYAGLGIILSGDGNRLFKGDYTIGDGVFIQRNRVRRIDGRRSNGQGGYIRSGIGEAHYNKSQTIRDNGGIVGFEIGNFVQFLQLALCPFDISDNEVLLELGCVNEDIVNWYGGSGARVEAPGFLRRNLIELVSRWDWNSPLTPGSNFQQDGMVRLNADCWQPTDNTTKSSDTGFMFGDEHNLSAYAQNTAYITAEDNTVFGTRTCINVHNGHHLILRRNKIAPTDRHRSGVLYTGVRYANYEISDGTSPDGQPAADKPGEPLWGHHEFTDNEWYRDSTTSVGSPLEIMQRNGGSSTGIKFFPRITDGGVQLVQNWNAMQQAAGRVIGPTLPA